VIIREIKKEDNIALAEVIRSVLIEKEVPKTGTAFEDEELDMMFETYQDKKSIYYVLVSDGNILGGGGITPLRGGDATVCELQKMYFSSEARGKGMGRAMIEKCIDFAKTEGFELCYLETMPNMHAAQKLYQKVGFEYIDHAMGNTGHCSCSVWMTKSL